MKLNRLQRVKLVLAMAIMLAPAICSNEIQAQENEKGFILSMTEFTIKGGHDNQFKEGIKAWKTCYLENGGTWTWSVWRRVTGEGNVYILTSRMDKWAEMDETDEASMKCRDLVRDMIYPHIESSERNFARFMPDYSRKYPNTDAVLWVTSWQVNNSKKFTDIAKAISEATAKAEGAPRGYWYSVMGGSKDVADYFVATPFKDFAAMDIERDNVWTIYEAANGKKKRDEMQAEFRSSTKEVWSYIYKRVDDLSHNP